METTISKNKSNNSDPISKDDLRQSIKEFITSLRELRITNPQRADAYLIRLADLFEQQEAA